MNPKPNLLTQVAAALPGLSKSETKVAQAILADPEAATQSSIANLAKSAGVSEPSVNRFSKRFGAKGFPDFKIQLATSLVSGVRYMSQAVEPSDDIASYPFKLFDNTISALILARDALPTEAIAEAVNLLSDAKRIMFLGLGTSAAVAKDAEHKFFRFNTPVTTQTDPLMLRMLAAGGACFTGAARFLRRRCGRRCGSLRSWAFVGVSAMASVSGSRKPRASPAAGARRRSSVPPPRGDGGDDDAAADEEDDDLMPDDEYARAAASAAAALGEEAAALDAPGAIWGLCEALLRHRHQWVQSVASRVVGHFLAVEGAALARRAVEEKGHPAAANANNASFDASPISLERVARHTLGILEQGAGAGDDRVLGTA